MPACHPCCGFIYMLISMQGHYRGWVSAGFARSIRLCWLPCRDPFWSLSASTRRLCWGVGVCDHLLNSGLHVALYSARAESIMTFCLVWTLHLWANPHLRAGPHSLRCFADWKMRQMMLMWMELAKSIRPLLS